MYSVFCLLLFILAVQTDGFTLDDVQCDHIFKQKCHGENVNNYNVIGYNSSVINYCTIKDVPNEINFTVALGKIERGESTHFLKIDFKPPETECRYGVALLVNPSIKNERECTEYNYEEAEDINTKVHTIEKTLCVLTDTNQLVRYNDNSTVSSCKENIELWFQYIFTGCYALRFHIARQEYIIKGHTFLNTTYRNMDITKPQFTCKYDIHSNSDLKSHEKANFTLDISLSPDIRSLLIMKLISDLAKDPQDPCIWHWQQPKYNWTINLAKASENHNCSVNMVQTNGEYMKTLQCNFQVQNIQATGYCFIFHIIDERCHRNTFWRPPINAKMPCTWLKRCARTFEKSLHIESTNVAESNKLSSTRSYLLLPIIAIVLIVLAIIGILCFMHYLRIKNEEVNLYVNPQQDDFMNPACFKSTDFSFVDNNGAKRNDHANLTYNDIVLLYTKSSSSFMALMKDFREMLAKMCSCSVHDWHDGAEWNNVAKVGAVLWFTELLNNGCRVIWVDTPTTRSVVISNLTENDSNLNKFSKYYEIGDFRDMAFPVVLQVIKHNIKDLTLQYRKHFIVRFEGLENSENIDDPFLDISSHMRYLMPQHFRQLCSDLSMVKPIISEYEMKAEEDLLQQHLSFMKMESI